MNTHAEEKETDAGGGMGLSGSTVGTALSNNAASSSGVGGNERESSQGGRAVVGQGLGRACDPLSPRRLAGRDRLSSASPSGAVVEPYQDSSVAASSAAPSSSSPSVVVGAVSLGQQESPSTVPPAVVCGQSEEAQQEEEEEEEEEEEIPRG